MSFFVFLLHSANSLSSIFIDGTKEKDFVEVNDNDNKTYRYFMLEYNMQNIYKFDFKYLKGRSLKDRLFVKNFRIARLFPNFMCDVLITTSTLTRSNSIILTLHAVFFA